MIFLLEGGKKGNIIVKKNATGCTIKHHNTRLHNGLPGFGHTWTLLSLLVGTEQDFIKIKL